MVSRRAVVDIIRSATLGSYGVVSFRGGSWLHRLAEAVGLPAHGIAVGLGDDLTIDLDLTVARGLPVAEVARQVDSAVRYAIRRALDRDVARLTIHIDGLQPGPIATDGTDAASPGSPDADGDETIGPDQLAASGSDVA
jgi:uncharacterized alkaline shock family protein YloU